MADGAMLSETTATTSHIPVQLRQRMLIRAATFSEGAQHASSPASRRRSSILSESSDTRHSFRSSTDSLPRPNGNGVEQPATSNEPSFWHSAPLVFAILPAAGGLVFQNGSAVVTDVLLLGLASMFLNWCVRAPWEWYHAAQRVQYVDVDDAYLVDTILEEDEENEGSQNADTPRAPAPISPDEVINADKCHSNTPTDAQKRAQGQLAKEEVIALAACFAAPLLGAYLLHTIRSQLTRPAEGLISDYNLTIFILAAELRPFAHVIKLKQAQVLHLQSRVRRDAKHVVGKADSQVLQRLADVETRLAQPFGNPDVEIPKIGALVRQTIQPQLDALNRAVRRYEKRQAAQSIQIEARFAEVDTRLKDALSLAAAAARTGQKPGMLSIVLTWLINAVTYGLQTSWDVFLYPYRITSAMTSQAKSWLFKPEHQPRKRIKGQPAEASSLSISRLQSRNVK